MNLQCKLTDIFGPVLAPIYINLIPACVCMCVAGRGGESLKLITRTTGAKVACSKEKTQGPGAKGNVTITGTRQEVKQAKVRVIHSVDYLRP